MSESPRGKCDGCGNEPRVLTRIESGQFVCRTCLREIRGPKRAANMASLEKMKELRAKGFDVSEELTASQAIILETTASLDCMKSRIPPGATYADVMRIWEEVRPKQNIVTVPGIGEIRITVGINAPELGEELRSYYTKVVGVTHANADGTSRQEIIVRCRQWEQLRFRPEPENPFDHFAIGVCRKNGEQIGHLNRELAETVTSFLKRGWRYHPIIKMFLDAGIEGHARGVVLLVIAAAPEVPGDELRAFAWEAIKEAKADLVRYQAARCRAANSPAAADERLE
jgi:hypothetical protein